MRARFVTVGRSFKERKRETKINPVVLVRIRGINMDLWDPKTYTQRERERQLSPRRSQCTPVFPSPTHCAGPDAITPQQQ